LWACVGGKNVEKGREWPVKYLSSGNGRENILHEGGKERAS